MLAMACWVLWLAFSISKKKLPNWGRAGLMIRFGHYLNPLDSILTTCGSLQSRDGCEALSLPIVVESEENLQASK